MRSSRSGGILPVWNPNIIRSPWEIPIWGRGVFCWSQIQTSKSSVRSSKLGRGILPASDQNFLSHPWEAPILEVGVVALGRMGYSCPKLAKKCRSLASSCITDSLSHTMCVETNNNAIEWLSNHNQHANIVAFHFMCPDKQGFTRCSGRYPASFCQLDYFFDFWIWPTICW